MSFPIRTKSTPFFILFLHKKVRAAVKQPTHNLLNVSNTDSKTWPHGGQGGLTTLKEDETKICFNLRDSCHQKWLSSNEAHSQVSCIHANEHPVRPPSLLGTFPSSVAVSVAAAGENFIVVKRRFLIRCPPWYGYRSSVRIFGSPLTSG